MIYHPHSKQIVGIKVGEGLQHDITLAKNSTKQLHLYRYILSDLGYYGLKEIGFNVLMPIKKQKNIPKFKEMIEFNRALSKYRIRIEHINRQLKCFKILAGRYRNRCKRFGLRVNLIAGLVNWMNRH